jgi:hypothetical protein
VLLSAVARRPTPSLPPAHAAIWWGRGVRDGEETIRVYAEEALLAIDRALSRGEVDRARELAGFFMRNFTPARKARRPDGRLSESWLDSDDELIERIMRRKG